MMKLTEMASCGHIHFHCKKSHQRPKKINAKLSSNCPLKRKNCKNKSH